MTIGVLKEPSEETRVSFLPEVVTALTKKGITVQIESGAGERAFHNDEDYVKAGAVIKSREAIVNSSDILVAIHPFAEVANLSSKIVIGVYQPLFNVPVMQQWAKLGITTFSLDMLPRTTRAQSMDVLSSQANIAGYKAVLLAANTYSRYSPCL
jgi:NAD(P) transhydrogenase subunit alpha